MKRDSFDFLTRLLRRSTGVAITESQTYLLEARLAPVVRRLALPGIDELAWTVRASTDGKVAIDANDAMLAGQSWFFRDWAPFEALSGTVLPGLVAARAGSEDRRLRIWSAGCAGGEEPYSIAMVLAAASERLSGVAVELVGTDVSPAALAKATAGFYTTAEIQRGLPVRLLLEHFKPDDGGWHISSAIQEKVEFRHHSLIESYRQLGTFDIVFCRNVLSSFEPDTAGETLRRIADLMPDDGVLFLGATESVAGAGDAFQPMPGGVGIYRRVARAQAARRAGM